MNMHFKPITITIYTIFVAVISSLMTVLFYHIFIFNSFSNSNVDDSSFVEFNTAQVLSSPIKEDNSIIEIFSYGCHYCALSHDNMAKFEKELPEGVTFKAIHLAMDNNLGLAAYAPIFATLEEMGVEAKLRQELYNSVINEKLDLTKKDILDTWLKQHDIDPVKYFEVSQSSAVKDRIKYMAEVTQYYQITGTPAFIINKRYVVYQDRDFPEFSAYMLELLEKSNKAPQ
ncbi:DsbA family protein [Providencia rettgeri]|uniref:DsbA family protein n=1 Tax=Providencia sp. TaxID=589 RepID=UPI0024AA5EC6|nr:DsbA family protein [Providencia rettgeri]ELR5233734.1 DsbA family protein [Providencia rettgeri]